jgi:histidinol-phosphate aminotransferase
MVFMINLSLNENPLPVSKKVLAALGRASRHINEYPVKEVGELKHAIAAYCKVKNNQVVLGNGASDILELIFNKLVAPGNEVIISKHSFILHHLLAERSKAIIKIIPEKNFQDDFVLILKKITKKTKLIVLTNPSNPLGQFIPFSILKSFLAKVPSSIYILIDEAYYEYMEVPDYQSACKLIKQYRNIIVVRTFSKAFGLAGLRLGYAIASLNIATELNGMKKLYEISSITLAAGFAAIQDKEQLKKTLLNNSRQKEKLLKFFEKNNYKIIGSSANFITLDCGSYAEKIFNHLKNQGVLTSRLRDYHLPDYLRVTIGTPSENNRLMRLLEKRTGSKK